MQDAGPGGDDREPIRQDPDLMDYPQPPLPEGEDGVGMLDNNVFGAPNSAEGLDAGPVSSEGTAPLQGSPSPSAPGNANKAGPATGEEEIPGIIVKLGEDEDEDDYEESESDEVIPEEEDPYLESHKIISREELERYNTVFEEYDVTQTGTIDREGLFAVLAKLGYPITDNEMLLLIPCCGLSFSNSYSFQAVISIMEYFKIEEKNNADTRDIDLVWEQLGGKGKGFIKTDTIKDVIKQYGLPLDLDFLMKYQMNCTDEQIEKQEITLEQLKALLMEPDKF